MDPIHVAFVDDEEYLHKLIKLKFRKELKDGSIIAHHFLDGAECLNFLRDTHNSSNISIIFSDITMPNMDGLTLVSHVKEEFPEIRRYLASALDVDEYKKRIGQTGIEEFIAKPIDFKRIKQIISEV